LNIWLYTAIPESEQFRRVVRPTFQRIKSTVRNEFDSLSTFLSGRFQLNDFHYQVANNLADNSNRGDIAIRLAVRQQISAALGEREADFVELGWGRLTDEIVERVNRQCDLFIISGGGYLFIHGDGAGGASFTDIAQLQKIRCPVVAYGIGLNRLMHEEVRELRDLPEETQNQLKNFYKACSHVSVRDAQTQELLNLYGGEGVSLIGDPVLFWRHGPGEKNPKERSGALSIGINLAAHGWRALAVLKPLLPNFVGLLKYVQRTYGAEYTYLMHHDFEKAVFSYLQGQGVRMNIVSASPLQLLEAYELQDFVICQMLHSSIFAANQDIPFLNIAYDQKNIAFCDLLGLSPCSISHIDLTLPSLIERFDVLFSERKALKKTIIGNKIPLKNAQTESALRTVALLSSSQKLCQTDSETAVRPKL